MPVEGCPCCVSDEEVAQLHAQPMEKLGEKILDRFIWSATLTWGDLNDLKHFLPRILELALDGQFDLWILAQRLESTKWREWPEVEISALEDAFELAWQIALKSENSGLLQEWLELYAALQEPISRRLLSWMNSENPQLRCEFAAWIASGQWQNQQLPNINELFTSQFTDALETQFFESTDPSCADTFSQAVDLVRSLAVWKSRNEN